MKLLEFQKDGVKFLLGKKRALLGDDPGLGKTVQTIVAANLLGELKGKALEILVICPKTAVINWNREIKKWENGRPNWIVINHDRLITKDFKDISKRQWDLIIADEPQQYLLNKKTLRAKAFLVLNKLTETVWLSTATIASKSAEDYFCIVQILLPGLFKNKDSFVKRYCKAVKDEWCYSGFRYEGFQNMEELNKIMSKCSIARKQHEVASDLPELTFTDYFADVTGFKDLEVELDDLENLNPSYHQVLKNNALSKIPSVIELVESYPKDVKAVVFAWHKEVVSAYVEAFRKIGKRVGFINSEVTSLDLRQRMIDDFQAGDMEILVLNIQSGGTAITLTAATKAIYVQFPHSVRDWKQSIKRVHRIGSKLPVQIIKVVVAGSSDEKIFKVLEERMKYVDEVGI